MLEGRPRGSVSGKVMALLGLTKSVEVSKRDGTRGETSRSYHRGSSRFPCKASAGVTIEFTSRFALTVAC